MIICHVKTHFTKQKNTFQFYYPTQRKLKGKW